MGTGTTGTGELTPHEMIRCFISFDTTSRNSNLPIIDFVRSYVESWGATTWTMPDTSGRKANLLVRVGPDAPGGVILSGHSDTVPVDGQEWHTNPFELCERDGNLHGRGTVDMKGFLAICTALVPHFARAGLRRPIYIAYSYDEELGCLGVGSLISRLKQIARDPVACIVGEPSSMDVLVGHMGARGYETLITGRDAHSSQTAFGVNAISAAGELIGFLNRLEEELRARGDPTGYFPGRHTTLNIGIVEGGVEPNIIAARCRLVWGYRLIPGGDENEVIDRFNHYVDEVVLPPMQRKAPEARITTTRMIAFDGLTPVKDSPAERLALRCRGHANSRTDMFGTEAGLFQQAGIPTVVCGPGDIIQAHRANEHISNDQVRLCGEFLMNVTAELTR